MIFRFLTAGMLLQLLLLPSCTKQTERLIVGSAASIALPLAEVADSFLIRHPGQPIVISPAGSNVILRQTTVGSPYEAVVLASSNLMDQLEESDDIDPASREQIAGNELCLILPVGFKPISTLSELSSRRFNRIAIGGPGVPVGDYARESLKNSKVLGLIEGRIINGRDVRHVLRYVELNEVDAGIVYRSDAIASSKIQIALTIPPALHSKISYSAAIPTTTRQKKRAKEFLQFLISPAGKQIFESYGFTVFAEPNLE